MTLASGARAATAPFSLSPQQIRYFETFGFLRLPGLFRDEIALITEGFEEVVADDDIPKYVPVVDLHDFKPRQIVMSFIDKSDKLRWLRDDPRILGVARSLIHGDFEYAESDGNVFSCESHWHSDTFGAPLDLLHVKQSFYLEPLTAESGAIRLIPGTNHHDTPFAKRVRDDVYDSAKISEKFGVDPDQIPSWTIDNEPGDVVVWNYRTVHASYNGGERRRSLSLSFREVRAPSAD